VFVPRSQHLTPEQEKAVYDQHQNNPQDMGYRQFLKRALAPLLPRIYRGMRGLDFGCGPGPTISVMLAEQGISVANYDPFYYPEHGLLDERYDFITMTEVIEHVARPAQVLQQVNNMLKPGGVLVVMTKRVRDKAAFANWHYKNDPTHIAFYAEETFHWIAQKMRWQCEIVADDVVLMHKTTQGIDCGAQNP